MQGFHILITCYIKKKKSASFEKESKINYMVSLPEGVKLESKAVEKVSWIRSMSHYSPFRKSAKPVAKLIHFLSPTLGNTS